MQNTRYGIQAKGPRVCRQRPGNVTNAMLPCCLVAFLTVRRENRLKKEFREMQFLTYINTLLCCCLRFLYVPITMIHVALIPRMYVPSAMRIRQRGTAKISVVPAAVNAHHVNTCTSPVSIAVCFRWHTARCTNRFYLRSHVLEPLTSSHFSSYKLWPVAIRKVCLREVRGGESYIQLFIWEFPWVFCRQLRDCRRWRTKNRPAVS
jgi:hypothetical protein